jgi:hypothetical protein
MGSAVVQVAYAVQQSDGTLSGWTVNQDHPLPCPVAAQAIAYDAVSNSIVLMGGDATGMGGDSTVVYQGTLDSNFDVTGWSFLPSLQGVTGPISRNAGATWNGYVYTLGGLVGLNDDTNAVYYLKGSVRSKRVGGPAKSCITPGSIRFRFKIIVECQLGGWTSTDQVLGTLVEETSDHLRCVDLQPS